MDPLTPLKVQRVSQSAVSMISWQSLTTESRLPLGVSPVLPVGRDVPWDGNESAPLSGRPSSFSGNHRDYYLLAGRSYGGLRLHTAFVLILFGGSNGGAGLFIPRHLWPVWECVWYGQRNVHAWKLTLYSIAFFGKGLLISTKCLAILCQLQGLVARLFIGSPSSWNQWNKRPHL